MLRSTNQNRLTQSLSYALALLAAVVLVANVPSADAFSLYGGRLLLYGGLTALAMFFACILADSELSPAHAIGILAFLALPEEAAPAALWAITLGSLLSGIILFLRSHNRDTRHPRLTWHGLLFVIAQQILSFYLAAQLYLNVGGILPLKRDTWDFDLPSAFMLGLYCLAYIVLYVMFFLIEYVPTKRVRQSDIVPILTVLFLPVPFAILAAVIANQLSAPLVFISILGLMLIITGLYAVSNSEFRLRRQLDELRTLSVVTRAMRAHLNLDALLKTVYLQVAHLLNTDDFTVALFNPDRNRLDFPLVIRHGEEDSTTDLDERPAIYGDPLFHHVITTGTPLLISEDAAETMRKLGLVPPQKVPASWLGVPLLAGGRSLGVISVKSEDPRRSFRPEDLRLLNIVAASASIAIENAQLYRQQTERAEQLSILNNIAQLLSGTLSPDSVLDTIISSASALSQANAVGVYVFMDATAREENDPYIRVAGLDEKFSTLPLLLRQPEIPLARQMPIAIADVMTDRRAIDLRSALARENIAALVELPMVMGETGLGVIVVYFKDTQYFSGERLEVLRTFSTQAAQAINNARTYAMTDEAFQRSVEQLLSLSAIGRMLTSTIDLKTICELILRHAMDATHTETGAVVLQDQDGGQLRVMAQIGYPDDVFKDDEAIKKSIGWGVLDGQPQRIDDVSKLGNYLRLVESTRSQLNVPILRNSIMQGSVVIGFITLESSKTARFTEEDSSFVAQLCNQALIAIDNARLFQRITEARDRLQVILDAMEEAIILIDSRGKIALANPRIALTGLMPEGLMNQSLTELLKQPSLNLATRLGFNSGQELLGLVEDMKMPEDWNGYAPSVFALQVDTGELYLQRYIIPVKDDQNQIMGALLVFYNKTEQQELDRAREELSRMIVHDLRSPLTAVTTSLKLLREFVPPESDFRALVESTTDASRRAIRKLLSRVDSLLDIARMQSGRLSIDPDVTELATLADNVIVELSPLAHELEIKIISQLDEALPLLNIDGDKVERLLLNLVDNALKYSPADSEIVIRAHPPSTKGAAPEFIRVDVSDRGPGIPPEYRETLFERYVQVEGRRKVRRGVGLGLTFCKLVVEAHGGRIWIEENPLGGSIFAFTLPVMNLTRLPEDENDQFPISNRE